MSLLVLTVSGCVFALSARGEMFSTMGGVSPATDLPAWTPGSQHQDRLTGEWVLVVHERTGLPVSPRGPLRPTPSNACPFCPGAEAGCGPQLARVEPGGGVVETSELGPWLARSVVNLWPMLNLPHEVLVLTPDHEGDLAWLDDANTKAAWDLLRERWTAHRAAGGVPTAFSNAGRLAAASQPHPHAQVLSAPQLSPNQAHEARVLTSGVCVLCTQAAHAERLGLLLAQHDGVALWCPEVSRFPFEMILAPLAHEAMPAPAADCAAPFLLREGLAALHATVGHPASEGAPPESAFNLAFHLDPGASSWHWHVHVLPRAGMFSGLHIGSATWTNPLPPPEAARTLRLRFPH